MLTPPGPDRQTVAQQRYEAYQKYMDFERQRELAGVFEDEATWLGETLNDSMHTEVGFDVIDGDLYAADGRPLEEMFIGGKEFAKELAQKDPRLAGELKRSEFEWEEYLLMKWMANDPDAPNTMVVNSALPSALVGSADQEVQGYKPARGLGWSRVITRNDTTGKIKISSQSLDGNNRAGYAAIYRVLGEHLPDDIDNDSMLAWRVHKDLSPQEQQELQGKLMAVYDAEMARQFGGEWHAGRRQSNGNTWQFVLSQEDLLKAHLEEIAPLILRQKRGDKSVDSVVEAIRYKNAATFKRRYEQGTIWQQKFGGNILAEQNAAAGEAKANGEEFSGCGLGVSATNALEQLGYGRHKIMGRCPACEAFVWYDPCEPDCPACHGKGRSESKTARRQNRHSMSRSTSPHPSNRPTHRPGATRPGGTVEIAGRRVRFEHRLQVGGTKLQMVDAATGKVLDD